MTFTILVFFVSFPQAWSQSVEILTNLKGYLIFRPNHNLHNFHYQSYFNKHTSAHSPSMETSKDSSPSKLAKDVQKVAPVALAILKLKFSIN